jgi:hypothetical protein
MGLKALTSPSAPTFDRGAAEPAFQAQRAGERADFTAPAAANLLDYSGFTPGADIGKAFGTLNPGQQQLLQEWMGPGVTPGGSALPSSAGELGNLGASAGGAIEPAAQGAAQGAGQAAAQGGMGVGSGLAGLGINAIGPVLGLIAQATGNEDLGKAAAGISGATTAGTAGLGMAGAGGALGGAGLSGLGALGGSLAAAAPAAAVASPAIIASLLSMLGGSQMNIMDMFTGGVQDPWLTFGSRLRNEEQKQGNALNYLTKALPYVQSQAQLQELVNAYRNGATGGPGELSPFLQSADPYEIKTIPGAGGNAHEKGVVADWGPVTEQTNSVIQALRGLLPESGGEGAPIYSTVETNEMRNKARNEGLNLNTLNNLSPADREAMLAQFPEAMDMGPQSAYWQQLMAGPQPAAPEAQSGMNVGSITPGPTGTPGAEAVGGAGKLSPNFITPELDLRAEAVQGAGRLGGGAQGGRGAGAQPFGMGGGRTGGMEGGMPPRGGMQPLGGAGGNSPFGGVPRQTMMPQPGGGVMQRRSNQGSRGAV